MYLLHIFYNIYHWIVTQYIWELTCIEVECKTTQHTIYLESCFIYKQIIFCHVLRKILKVLANNKMLSIFEQKHCFLESLSWYISAPLCTQSELNLPLLLYHTSSLSFYTFVRFAILCSITFVIFYTKNMKRSLWTDCSLTFLILKLLLN